MNVIAMHLLKFNNWDETICLVFDPLQEPDESENGIQLLYLGWSWWVITFQSTTEAQIVYTDLWMMDCFPPYTIFFYSRSNASLSLVYLLYPCKISGRATFLPAKTDHAAYMEANHSHYICMTLVMYKFHSDHFLIITLALWNGIPGGGSPEQYKLNFFLVRLNRYLSQICS